MLKLWTFLSLWIGFFAMLFYTDLFMTQRKQILDVLPTVIRDAITVRSKGIYDNNPQTPTKNKNSRTFTKEELALYDGTKGSKGLYLAVLGEVFDVKKGSRHYGPDGGYSFFAGKDASRAFVTGEFEKGLVEDVSGLASQDLLGLDDWSKFYHKDYVYVGKLVGRFYDNAGNPTAALKDYHKELMKAHEWKAVQKTDETNFPGCNSEWSKEKGGRVWCSNKSGGINRDWDGVPRVYHMPGGKSKRCACVRTRGPATGNPADTADQGDLNNPNFRPYEDCALLSSSCKIKQ